MTLRNAIRTDYMIQQLMSGGDLLLAMVHG